MNLFKVFRLTFIALLIVSGFMLFSIPFAFYYGERELIKWFLFPVLGVLLFTLLLFLPIRNRRFKNIRPKEAFLLVSLSWIASCLVGALPFYLSGSIPSYVDAFFETMSGFTTTGASILTNIEGLPKSILFWRSMTHWLGGMGIVFLTVAILPLLGIGNMQLVKAELPGVSFDKITPKMTQTAKLLWLFYLGLTILETLFLFFGGLSFFDALTHTFGTLATGGFSPRNASVGAYNSPYVEWVITVFMILAGTNFILFHRLLTGKIKDIVQNTEFRVYLGIFFVATAFISVNLILNQGLSPGDGIRSAGFQVASILTSTGFITTDYILWPALSQFVLFSLMFIGACSGSTGGGIKVIRIVSLFKQGQSEMKRLLHPRGVFGIRLNKKAGRKDIIYSISGFIFLYIFIVLFTALVTSSGGYSIDTSLSAALATVGNIGPGFGAVGPVLNYAGFPDYIKLVHCFAMMVGRLEIFTVMILFTRSYWR